MVTAENPRPVAAREPMHKMHSMRYTACGISIENASATYVVTSFRSSTTCADCRHALSKNLEGFAEEFDYVVDHDPNGMVEILRDAAAALARDPSDAPLSPPTISTEGGLAD